MKISDNGLNLIKKFEGCRLTAYQDVVGVWTIGYGTTNADKAITGTTICQGLKISQATADDWLRQSVDKKYGPKVDKYSAYNWNQNEYDALVSFAYNIGSIDGLTAKGTRTRSEIAAKILEYNKGGGKILSGLVRRRQEERKLFLTPVTVKTGWQQENNYWKYQNSDGMWIKNKWCLINHHWYLFDKDGYLLIGWHRWNTNQKKVDPEDGSGDWYYLQENGEFQGACWHGRSNGALELWYAEND